MSPEVDSLRVIGGRYELEVCIGRGGMGEVWRARHVALNSHVAIKLLHGALASENRTRQRFLKEAQVTAQLKTRHAVQVFDFGITDEGLPFLVMELLDGETLDQRLGKLGRLTPEATVRILRPASRALDRAHQLGIIHRDFKPENLFIIMDEEGGETVKVVDFGIAKLVGDLEPDSSSPSSLREGRHQLSTFTRTATLVGTPYYMGPEQIAARPLTPAVDIWAVGIVAFECLTGQRPFDGDELASLFNRIERRDHPRASDLVPDVPPSFEDWFDRACALDPRSRFTTAHQAVVELAKALGIDTGADGMRATQDSQFWELSGLVPGVSGSMPLAQLNSQNSGFFTPVGPILSRGAPGTSTPVPAMVSRGPSEGVMSVSTRDAGGVITALRRLPRSVRLVGGVVGSLALVLVAIGLTRGGIARGKGGDRSVIPAATEGAQVRTGQLVAPSSSSAGTIGDPPAGASRVSNAASAVAQAASVPGLPHKADDEARGQLPETLPPDDDSKRVDSERGRGQKGPGGGIVGRDESNRGKRGSRNAKAAPAQNSSPAPAPANPLPAPPSGEKASPFNLPPLGL